jgi:copper(I)-binding protein
MGQRRRTGHTANCGLGDRFTIEFFLSLLKAPLMKYPAFVAAALLATSLLSPLAAQTIDVKDAWVRATVPGQKATGAFMKITARDGATLLGASSPAAGVVQVHEMKMDAGVMSMRALDGGLALPAGQAVELKPGGYHVMLMDLKAPLQKDTLMPLTLVVKNAQGVQSRLELKVKVSAAAPDTAAHDMSQHKH